MVDKSLKEWMWQVTSSGGGGGDHEELTQAEYDALTDAEKTNGTVYFVTDGIPSSDIYTLKKATGANMNAKWTNAITNAKSEIICVAKGYTTANIALSITVPVEAIESTTRYWEVSDSHNTATVAHFQVILSKTSANPTLYYGANAVSGAVYEYYYR